MARHKEFDPDAAAQEAMEAFWENGYFATSVNDLLAEMGLNRGSLYDTFGDKKRLFLAALEKYGAQVDQELASILDKRSAREAIRDLLREAARRASSQRGRRGCLACKAAMEMAPHDPDIAAWVRRFHRAHVEMVAKTIQRGQRQGEIDCRVDPRAAARFLLNGMAGLHLLGTISPSEGEVQDVVKLLLKVLD
jgi:TetR/AcrR family transcriptional repressor of nem operon